MTSDGLPLSVLVPTYNRAAYLPATLTSILTQTVPVDEVLLIDDGSTDNTAGVVERFVRDHPAWKTRIRYIRQDNQGKSVALNVGLRYATGDWIAFNDSDDLWLPEKLELQFQALGMFPDSGACFTDVRFTNNPGICETAFEQTHRHYRSMFGKEPGGSSLFVKGWSGIYMQTVLTRISVMREVGKFDATVRISMDSDFIVRLGLVTPLCFVNLPLVNVDRTPHRAIGLMTEFPSISLKRLEVQEQLMTKWLSILGARYPTFRRRIIQTRSSAQSAIANAYILRNDFETARGVLRRAMRQNLETRLIVKWLLTRLAPAMLWREVCRRHAD